jgi:serine/threonine protein kinase
MDNKILKTGSCSIVLGNFHYSKFINHKPNKLIKFTKVIRGHNEFKYLKLIKKIENYNDYYALPDDEQFILKPSDKFYKILERLVKGEKINIFYGNLIYNYIDYCGIELLDTIIDIKDNYDYTFWRSYKTIIEFSQKILEGLNYLHQNKICHLDIKPENIIVDKLKRKFKIIDFGFSSLEPFDEFVNDIRGTPGYLPKLFLNYIPSYWLPKVTANDFIIQPIPHIKERNLVYKIDSYCFGRVLYFLKVIYQDNLRISCFNFEKKDQNRLNTIIKSLIEDNVYQRFTPEQCLTQFFE